MSTAAIVVVVVGACIGVVTSIMTRTLEPATKRPAHERGGPDVPAEVVATPEPAPEPEPPTDLDLGPEPQPPTDLDLGPEPQPALDLDLRPEPELALDLDLDRAPAPRSEPASAPLPAPGRTAGPAPGAEQERDADSAAAPEPVAVPAAPLPPGLRPPSIRAARAQLAAAPATAPTQAPAPAPPRVLRARTVVLPRDVGVPHRPTRWWERLRSAVALTTMSVVLGLLAAAAVGVAVVALFSLLRSAVG